MYRQNLAYVHHRGFQQFTRSVGPELLTMLRSRGIAGGHVVDLGCGDGTWLRALIDAGFDATGVDQSQPFVRLARIAAPGARVVRASLYGTDFPRCDAITALGEVFNYLPSSTGPNAALLRVFERAHAALRPGGVLLFDMLVSGRPAMNYETARVADDWAVFVRVTEDRRRQRLSRHIFAFRRSRSHYTREKEVHTLRVPSRSRVLSDLRRAGFHASASPRYGTLPLAPRRLAFMATKPTAAPRQR